MFTQLRDADGEWSGEITVTCHALPQRRRRQSGRAGDGPGPDLRRRQQPRRPEPLPARLPRARLRGVGRDGAEPQPHARPQQREPDQPRVRRRRRQRSSPEIVRRRARSGSTADMDTPGVVEHGPPPGEVRRRRVPDGRAARRHGLLRADARDHAAGPGVDARERPRPEHLGRGAEGAAPTRSRSTPRSPSRARVLFHTLDLWAPERNNPIRAAARATARARAVTAPTRRAT